MVKIKETILETVKNNFGASGNEFDMRIFRHFIEGANSSEVSPDGEFFTFHTFYRKDRYFFDFQVDYSHWMQVDNSQDASYYGTWCSPKLLTKVSYVEGDITVVVTPDSETFLKMMKEHVEWAKSCNTWVGFDEGLMPGLDSQAFIEVMKKWNG